MTNRENGFLVRVLEGGYEPLSTCEGLTPRASVAWEDDEVLESQLLHLNLRSFSLFFELGLRDLGVDRDSWSEPCRRFVDRESKGFERVGVPTTMLSGDVVRDGNVEDPGEGSERSRIEKNSNKIAGSSTRSSRGERGRFELNTSEEELAVQVENVGDSGDSGDTGEDG